jgi:ATP-dependent Clp protease ATP-binding subunit ClpA
MFVSREPVTHLMQMTPRCRTVLTYAKESLSRLGHSHVSSAHLVLGLLTLHGGVADNLLRKSGLSVQHVEGYLSSRCTSAEESTIQDGFVLGGSARSALDRAEAETRARQFTYVGVEHLSLGILAEESGEATDLFASVHGDREKLRQMIEQEIQ